MRFTKLFTKTRKDAPAGEAARNAELLLRAGFIFKEMAGVYSFLPLGLRVLNKIEGIIPYKEQIPRERYRQGDRIRAYILDLRPRQMDQNDGLLAGIKRLAAEFRANTLAAVTVSGSKARLDDLPQTHSLALFHICQEALGNAAKHAGAKRVTVNLWNTDERVLMEVRDNGRGFDANVVHPNSLGLAGMKQRLSEVGGTLKVESILSVGTTVTAEVQLPTK